MKAPVFSGFGWLRIWGSERRIPIGSLEKPSAVEVSFFVGLSRSFINFHTLGLHKVSGGTAVLLLVGTPRSLEAESPTPTLCPGLGFRVHGFRALLALGFMVLG